MSGRGASTGTGPAAVRRFAWPAVIVAVLLLVGLSSVLAPRQESRPGDPDSPGPTGSRAVARVLTEHKQVKVEAVRSRAEMQQARVDADTTVLVVDAARLSAPAADAVAAQARSAGRLVLLAPDDDVLERLGVPARRVDADVADTASCSSDDVAHDDRLPRDFVAFVVEGGVRAQSCFPIAADDDAIPAAAPVALGDAAKTGGAYVEIAARVPRPYTVLVGAESLLDNATIGSRDDAGIAVRSLAHHPRIVWFVPPRDETPIGAGRTPVPAWFVPGLLVIAAAALTLCLWRGRRLGRLVTEPLPALVHAIETTKARGRLYRQAKDPERAWRLVRDAAEHRLRQHFSLPADAPTEHVAAAVAGVTGRPLDQVRRLLTQPPADDGEFVTATIELRSLDREVHTA